MNDQSISLIYRVDTPDDRYFESVSLDGVMLKVGDKVMPLEPIVRKLLAIVGEGS